MVNNGMKLKKKKWNGYMYVISFFKSLIKKGKEVSLILFGSDIQSKVT